MKHTRRHRILYAFLRVAVGPFLRCFFRYRYPPPPELPQPFVVMANHNIDLDPALVAMACKKQMYFLASEHMFRWGVASKLIKWVFAPIVRVKGKTESRAGMEMVRMLRRGHNVCVFPEGNRSFNGLTMEIVGASGKLVKSGGAALVTFRTEGGYLTSPRWGRNLRKGRLYGHVVNVYPAQQVAEMSADEVNRAIQTDLCEDPYARQRQDPVPYKGKNLAQDIQTVLYCCPQCRRIASLTSRGNGFSCECGLHGEYTEYGFLQGEGFAFETIAEWDAWQVGQLRRYIGEHPGGKPLLRDEEQTLYEVQPAVTQTPVATGPLTLDKQMLHCAGRDFPLAQIADIAVTGQMTMTFSTTDGAHYEIRSAQPRSAYLYQTAYRILNGAGD